MAALSKRDLAQASQAAVSAGGGGGSIPPQQDHSQYAAQQQQQMQHGFNGMPAPGQYNMNMQQQNQQMMPSGPGPSMTVDRYGNPREVIYAYGEHEDVQGVAHLILAPGKKFEHLGIKIEFVGRVDMVSINYGSS